MKKTRKLMWKIFMFLLVFCAILISILWILETTMLETMYQSIRKSEIQKAIVLVEKNIDNPDLSSIIEELQYDSEIVVNQTNSFVSPGNPSNSSNSRNTSQMPKGPGMGKNRIRQTINETREFIKADGSTVSYSFYAIISPVKATISTIKVQLYYVTGIMIFLSVILAIIIAKIVSKPIEKLNESAKVLATGNYDVHFSGDGYREIHELSNTLNYTASELSKVENLRKELMANISHDLRTPLALVYGYAEMMHDFPNEINEEQTEVIMSEVNRLSSLVDDIFDVSQLESGNIGLNISRYNLTESIRKTVKRINNMVKKDGYNIDFIESEEVFVDADEVKITQALYNLLINAIHYSGDNPNIKVCQIIEGKSVKIEVIDKGQGIEEKNIPYIWDRYYKTDKAHRRAIIGTGLGLSIVKKIIEMHGGEYGVESELGKGSKFWFSIKNENNIK